MSFETQRTQALAILAKTGIWKSNYEPPLLRLLWRLGFKIPPPHFASFGQIVIVGGAWFGPIWCLAMWPLVSPEHGVSALFVIIVASLVGLLFGVTMAAYYSYGKRKYNLPTWGELGAE